MSGSNHLVRLQTWKKVIGWCTVQWKMLLFCAKTIVKVAHKFELTRLKKKKKKKKKEKKKKKQKKKKKKKKKRKRRRRRRKNWCVVCHENIS